MRLLKIGQIMFNLLLLFWKKQKTVTKILLVTLLLSFMYSTYLGSKYAYLKYQYFKRIEKELTQLKINKKEIEKKEVKIVRKAKKRIRAIQQKAKLIDTNLKKENENNNNISIDDSELYDYIAEHQKR